MTTITIKPSELNLGFDYFIWDDLEIDHILEHEAFKWCKENGINVGIALVTDNVERVYTRESGATYSLEHEENFIQIEFNNDADALLFKLTWLDL